jgi:DNA repair exonuclease SbcCD ATPase subunit
MIIKSVRIHNILSIEDAFVEFDESGLMLIEGWNYDVGRANGAGKTAIFNAISFALFDKLPRKVTATEIVRRGHKNGYVEVCLSARGASYTVNRSRPKGVGFTKGGLKLEITQSEWEATLGLNYNQFILSMYAAQGGSVRFLSINDSEKKQFLLQLLNLEEFSSCRLVADSKVKNLEGQLVAVQSKVDNIDSKMDAYQESLIDENVYNHHIDLCNRSIVEMTGLLIEAQQVSRPDLSRYAKLEEDANAKRIQFARTRARREALAESFKKLSKAISDSSEDVASCPTCGSVIDTTHAKATREKEVAKLSVERAEVKRAIDDCDVILRGEEAVGRISRQIRERKASEGADYESARARTSDISTKIALKNRELKELSSKLQSNAELWAKLRDLGVEREKTTTLKSVLLKEVELFKTIASLYSPTGAQAYILDHVIDSFNERVSEYVSFLWSNMTYQLKSYKETVKGDVTAKFSEHLMMDGRPVSIGSLSGGEFRALSLCVDFALVDVMERQFGIAMSPIILDEPFDGLDGAGREFIMELLEKFSSDRQVVVIDHTSEVKSMFSKVLTVEKRNGVSTVSLQA